jgi:hypothetical protein
MARRKESPPDIVDLCNQYGNITSTFTWLVNAPDKDKPDYAKTLLEICIPEFEKVFPAEKLEDLNPPISEIKRYAEKFYHQNSQ